MNYEAEKEKWFSSARNELLNADFEPQAITPDLLDSLWADYGALDVSAEDAVKCMCADAGD